MIRLRLFGRCRIYHDPVSPVLKSPARIGWDSWFRKIDLITPVRLKGEELLMRMKGWWTVDPAEISVLAKKYGSLVLGEQGELMVELPDENSAEQLSIELKDKFNDQVLLAP